MTTPVRGVPGGVPRQMTPERWRTVDAILQAALACDPERRDAVVAEACGGDDALRVEIASLLAANVHAADDFLERPPLFVDTDGASRGTRGRTVSARSAMYAAIVMLAVGLTGGLLAARSVLGRGDRVGFGESALAAEGELTLTLMDRTGRPLREIGATRPWTPRFSADGRQVAYGAFGAGRETSDLWVTDLQAGTTRRITDDDGDANDPQWSSDGARLVYSVSASDGKDVMLQSLGARSASVLAPREGVQFPSDWLRDGSALLVTDITGSNQRDIIVQPTDGSAARPYAATSADERSARSSPDGRWVAYTSDESGRAEVYLDSYPNPGRRIVISSDGGVDPVWRGDGRELYYWRADALMAVSLGAAIGGAAPVVGERSILFRAPYPIGVSTMYDVSPDGQRFVVTRQAPARGSGR